jgi:hypothetical protein
MHISLSSFSVSLSISVVDQLQLSPPSSPFILPIFSYFMSYLQYLRLSHSQGAPSVIFQNIMSLPLPWVLSVVPFPTWCSRMCKNRSIIALSPHPPPPYPPSPLVPLPSRRYATNSPSTLATTLSTLMTGSFRSAAWVMSYIVRQDVVVYTYNECCRQYGDKDLVSDVGEAKVNEHWSF